MNEKPTNRIFKTSIFVLLMTVLCLAFAMTASAETTDDGYKYTIKNGEVTITGYEGTETDLVIPNEIEGCPVTSIGSFAFHNCTGLKSITIPDTVTTIGSYAFSLCTDLTSLIIPDSVSVIGDSAFMFCTSLKKINLPHSLTTISKGTFSSCVLLDSIVLPDGVEIIGDDAFNECHSLTDIFISRNVKAIGCNAFRASCSFFTVDPQNQYFSSDENGVLYNKDKSALICYPAGSKNTEYIMPNSVKEVYESAFSFCIYLNKLVFSNNVEEINEGTIFSCFRLTDITLPKTLKYMHEGSIYYCCSLENIVLPENLGYAENHAVFGLPSLKTLTIKSMDSKFCESSLCETNFLIKDNILLDDFINSYIETLTDFSKENSFYDKYMETFEEPIYIGTIICHSGSTAEAYAKENGIDYETVHFFGDWVYDWDNLFREHTCTICGYAEKENLEKETDGGVEVIKPADPDKKFEVDEIEKNSSKYILIEESFKHHHDGKYNIIRSFDITFKNKDGVHVQPDGTVKVKLPHDWNKHGVYKVYRVNDDGTLTDMNAYREGSHLVFDTDHFSIYVIVDESGEQPDTDDSGNNTSSNAFSAFLNKIRDLFKIIIEFFKSLGRK